MDTPIIITWACMVVGVLEVPWEVLIHPHILTKFILKEEGEVVGAMEWGFPLQDLTLKEEILITGDPTGEIHTKVRNNRIVLLLLYLVPSTLG